MATSIELKADRNLLNPNFEGYKLSLDKLPIYNTKLENGVDSILLTDDQFSYHHAKLFGMYNHLIQDPWNPSSVYFIDNDWNITHVQAQETSVDISKKVYKVSDAEKQQGIPGRCNVGVRFLSANTAVVADGAGQLYIVDTGNRTDGNVSTWKTLLTKAVPEECQPCLLVDAVELSSEGNHKIECLLVHVGDATPEQKDKYRTQFLTVLEWVTFTSADRKTWCQDRARQLLSRRPFNYISLGRDGQSITVSGEADFIFTRDSEQPVVSDEEKEAENTDSRPPDYTWHQTTEDISVQFTVPDDVGNKDIYMNLTHNHLDFGVKNKAELLKGNLCGEVDTGGSTWTIDGRRIDVTLTKKVEGNWPLVVEGDTRGEMLMDPAEAAAIHEQLAHLTSEEWNPSPDKESKPYNTQQLEECDMYPNDDSVLICIHGNTHKITHRIGLGSHQWLFNVESEQNSAPLMCLRHDVDGLLWKQETNQSGEPSWKHSSTFNAFGYVQASKQQKRYSTCPPDCSYALICDNTRHIYLYRQSSPVTTPLRNRKTGKQVNAVAKQQVVTLEMTETILGLVAADDKFFVATKNKLYMVKV